MNLYAPDLSVLDFNFGFSPDSIDEPFSIRRSLLNSGLTHLDEDYYGNGRYGRRHVAPNPAPPPPSHRHDGTSPLPMGMDWSPPPRKWVLFPFCCFDPIFQFIDVNWSYGGCMFFLIN